MIDPTIHAALEAATREACACDCTESQAGCRAQVAQEIAAFLRALPSHIGNSVAMFTPNELATAVEEAARHD